MNTTTETKYAFVVKTDKGLFLRQSHDRSRLNGSLQNNFTLTDREQATVFDGYNAGHEVAYWIKRLRSVGEKPTFVSA